MGKGQASCTLESVFLSAGKLNGLSLSSSDVLDRVLVCILSQSLSSCVFLFVSNPRFLSLFCQSAFAPYFLQVFAFYVFFWILRLFFAHCSDFCILSQVSLTQKLPSNINQSPQISNIKLVGSFRSEEWMEVTKLKFISSDFAERLK